MILKILIVVVVIIAVLVVGYLASTGSLKSIISKTNISRVTVGANIPGYQIGDYVKNVATVEACEDLCKANPKCQWYDYNSLGKYCYLKAGSYVPDQLIPKPSEVGFKLADNTFASYDKYYIGETLPDGSTNNLPYMPIVGLTVEECRSKCAADNTCSYYRYGYDVNPRECHLKQLTNDMLMTHGNVASRTT